MWDDDKRELKRHFSHFDKDGKINVFAYGETSWSSGGENFDYKHWKLVEEE